MHAEKIITSAIFSLAVATGAALATGGHREAPGQLPAAPAAVDPADGISMQHYAPDTLNLLGA